MPALCVAASIAHLVSVEVIKGFFSTFRMWTNVAVMWIETVINVATEVMWPVEPRAGSDEHAAAEPLRPVITIWCAVVRIKVVVAIGTSWFCSDIDRDLSGRRARKAQQSCNQGSKGNKFQRVHRFILIPKKSNRDAKAVIADSRSHLRQVKGVVQHTLKIGRCLEVTPGRRVSEEGREVWSGRKRINTGLRS